jgi:hypothetical protein
MLFSNYTEVRHVTDPLRVLMAAAKEAQRYLMARTLFSTIHGVVSLDVEDWQVRVPAHERDSQIEKLLRIICSGLC